MNKIDKQYVKQTKAWIKTQEVGIKSCDVNIAILQQQIRAEEVEKAEKIKLKQMVEEQLQEFIHDKKA